MSTTTLPTMKELNAQLREKKISRKEYNGTRKLIVANKGNAASVPSVSVPASPVADNFGGIPVDSSAPAAASFGAPLAPSALPDGSGHAASTSASPKPSGKRPRGAHKSKAYWWKLWR